MSALTVFMTLFIAFERQVLIGTALLTDGCCYCAADCGIAITHQYDSNSFVVGCWGGCVYFACHVILIHKISPSCAHLLLSQSKILSWSAVGPLRQRDLPYLQISKSLFVPPLYILPFSPNFTCSSHFVSWQNAHLPLLLMLPFPRTKNVFCTQGKKTKKHTGKSPSCKSYYLYHICTRILNCLPTNKKRNTLAWSHNLAPLMYIVVNLGP